MGTVKLWLLTPGANVSTPLTAVVGAGVGGLIGGLRVCAVECGVVHRDRADGSTGPHHRNQGRAGILQNVEIQSGEINRPIRINIIDRQHRIARIRQDLLVGQSPVLPTTFGLDKATFTVLAPSTTLSCNVSMLIVCGVMLWSSHVSVEDAPM